MYYKMATAGKMFSKLLCRVRNFTKNDNLSYEELQLWIFRLYSAISLLPVHGITGFFFTVHVEYEHGLWPTHWVIHTQYQNGANPYWISVHTHYTYSYPIAELTPRRCWGETYSLMSSYLGLQFHIRSLMACPLISSHLGVTFLTCSQDCGRTFVSSTNNVFLRKN